MIISRDLRELHTNLATVYCSPSTLGFVPTMGALHEGHASLIRKSAAENPETAVSIFVNPTQFGPGEDLDQYPRTLEADLALCEAAGATHVFCPSAKEMYPEGRDNFEITLGLRSLDKILCGASRPGHFDGVLQVVSKLFNLVRPDRAYFGRKDYQQYIILRRLAAELFFPVEIVPCPIVREPDGLAMSSRNAYLKGEERRQALFLSHALQAVRKAAKPGMRVRDLEALVDDMLKDYPLVRLDYFEVRNGADLSALEVLEKKDAPVALIAAFCGPTRLIDNMSVWEKRAGAGE